MLLNITTYGVNVEFKEVEVDEASWERPNITDGEYVGGISLQDDLPVSISLSRRRVSMERLSDGGHAVGQAVQAPRVQAQTSVSHVAAKHKRKLIRHGRQ